MNFRAFGRLLFSGFGLPWRTLKDSRFLAIFEQEPLVEAFLNKNPFEESQFLPRESFAHRSLSIGKRSNLKPQPKNSFFRPTNATKPSSTRSPRTVILLAFLMVGALGFAAVNLSTPAQAFTASFTTGNSATTWTVPSGVTSITITILGAAGGTGGCDGRACGGNAGGFVGQVSGTLSVSAGSNLTINVGSGGSNGSTGTANGGGNGGLNPLSGFDGGRGGNAGSYGSSGGGGLSLAPGISG
jgi:hypothetical protein